MTRAWRLVVAALMAVTMSQLGGPPALAAVPSIQVYDGPYLWDLGADFPELNVGVTVYAMAICDATPADNDAVFSASMTQKVNGVPTTVTSESQTVDCAFSRGVAYGFAFFGDKDFHAGKATFTFTLTDCPTGCPYTVTKTLNVKWPPSNVRTHTNTEETLIEHPCTGEILAGTVSSSTMRHAAPRNNPKVGPWFNIATHGELTGLDSGQTYRFHFHGTFRFDQRQGVHDSNRTVLSGSDGSVSNVMTKFKLNPETGDVELVAFVKLTCH